MATESSVTPQSIKAAKAQQAAERDRVFQQTGIRVTDEWTELPASYPPKRVVVHCICSLCKFTASAKTEGRAIRSRAPHLVRAHGWAPKGGAA